MNYDNPAVRLLAIINEGKGHSVEANCRKVWEKILRVENNNPLLMSRFGNVMELPEAAINAIRDNYPNQGNTWSHWESQVNGAFMSQDLNGQWQSFIGRIDGHTITYLTVAADLLHAKSNTKAILGDEVSALRDSLNEILSTVISGDLPEDVKKFVVRNIRKILLSIDEYSITGALPILDAVESTLGHAHIDKQYWSFLRDTELGKRLLDTLRAMANVVTIAVGLPQLSQALMLLPK
jgi:hypothetical protein